MRNFAVIAALALAGCSLLTDLDGYSDPVPDAGTESGAAPSDAAMASNAEAGSDAASVVDAGPPSLCAGSHVFCTNFDKAELMAEWDSVTPGNGTIAREGAASVSAPYSLLVTHPTGHLAITPNVTKTINVQPLKGLHCRFQYRRAEVDKDGVLVLLTVDFNTATKEHFFAEVKDGLTEGRVYLAATAADGTGHDDFPIVPTVSSALHDWATVDWVLDFTKPKSTLMRDDQIVDERTTPPFDPARVTSIKLVLGLGDFADPTAGWTVRYDDFVCDAL